MAKKTQKNKAPRATTPRMYSDGAAAPKTTSSAQPAASSSSAATTTRSAAGAAKPITTGGRGAMSLEQEYAYVMGDLKRLGIAAIGGFVFIIIAGFLTR